MLKRYTDYSVYQTNSYCCTAECVSSSLTFPENKIGKNLPNWICYLSPWKKKSDWLIGHSSDLRARFPYKNSLLLFLHAQCMRAFVDRWRLISLFLHFLNRLFCLLYRYIFPKNWTKMKIFHSVFRFGLVVVLVFIFCFWAVFVSLLLLVLLFQCFPWLDVIFRVRLWTKIKRFRCSSCLSCSATPYRMIPHTCAFLLIGTFFGWP